MKQWVLQRLLATVTMYVLLVYVQSKLALYGLGFFLVPCRVKFAFVSLGNEPGQILHVHDGLGSNGLDKCKSKGLI